jgi:3'-5' exoribonuclease 1
MATNSCKNTKNQRHNQTDSMAALEFYDYICVIDFEATCTENCLSDFPHEIIEFPIVLINIKTMQIVCHLFIIYILVG